MDSVIYWIIAGGVFLAVILSLVLKSSGKNEDDKIRTEIARKETAKRDRKRDQTVADLLPRYEDSELVQVLVQKIREDFDQAPPHKRDYRIMVSESYLGLSTGYIRLSDLGYEDIPHDEYGANVLACAKAVQSKLGHDFEVDVDSLQTHVNDDYYLIYIRYTKETPLKKPI